jgi:hypothetical protein
MMSTHQLRLQAKKQFFAWVDEIIEKMVLDARGDLRKHQSDYEPAVYERILRDMDAGFRRINHDLKRRFDTDGDDWFARFEDAILDQLGESYSSEVRVMILDSAIIFYNRYQDLVLVHAIEKSTLSERPAKMEKFTFAASKHLPEEAAATVADWIRHNIHSDSGKSPA